MPAKKATPQRKPHHKEDESFHAAEKAYSAAMGFYTRQNWSKAREAFGAFLEAHGTDREFTDMAERARTHLRVCERRVAPAEKPKPENADGWLLQGVVLSNEGDIEGALHSLQQALDLGATPSRVHYTRAAALALAGRHEESLEDLAKAIEDEPSYRYQSLADPDFEQLRETAGYVALVEPPHGADDDDDIDDEDAEDAASPYDNSRSPQP